jgi:hypothetical protein
MKSWRIRVGEARNPGPDSNTASKDTLRFLSWNLGSWDKRGLWLLDLADKWHVDVIFLQEHGVRASREPSLSAELRKKGWQAFWGPMRPWGAGEVVLVNRRYAAFQADRKKLSTVMLALKMVVTSESPTFMFQVATITPVIVPVKPLMITLQPGLKNQVIFGSPVGILIKIFLKMFLFPAIGLCLIKVLSDNQ